MCERWRVDTFTMIQDKKGKTNFDLFNFIVNGEILTNELSLENQVWYINDIDLAAPKI